jgi:hypothetical protein
MLKSIALLLLIAVAAFAADLTGTWVGSFEQLRPDGSVANTGTAQLVLKLSGRTVTGSAGSSGNEQHEIQHGQFDGRQLSFEISPHQGFVVKFDLTFDDETLKGNAAGSQDGRQLRARLDLRRKSSAAPAAPADDRAADREAIRAHIDRIFQAFIHKDRAELQATHAANWLGYLEGSRQTKLTISGRIRVISEATAVTLPFVSTIATRVLSEAYS